MVKKILNGTGRTLDLTVSTSAAKKRNPKKQIRNLIYHATPIGSYQSNLDLLLPHWELFNGKIIIAVAEDREKGISAKAFQKLLPQTSNLEVLPFKNDAWLRESATLLDLLAAVHSFNDDEVTCYAHTKGVSHQKNPAVALWTEQMYRCNMTYFDTVAQELEKWPMVGSFARYGRWKHFPKGSDWHYSGTFYWFRHSDLFRRDWTDVPLERYTAEAYPSLLYDRAEVGVAFYDGVENLYDYKYIKGLIDGKIKTKKTTGKMGLAGRVVS